MRTLSLLALPIVLMSTTAMAGIGDWTKSYRLNVPGNHVVVHTPQTIIFDHDDIGPELDISKEGFNILYAPMAGFDLPANSLGIHLKVAESQTEFEQHLRETGVYS